MFIFKADNRNILNSLQKHLPLKYPLGHWFICFFTNLPIHYINHSNLMFLVTLILIVTTDPRTNGKANRNSIFDSAHQTTSLAYFHFRKFDKIFQTNPDQTWFLIWWIGPYWWKHHWAIQIYSGAHWKVYDYYCKLLW